MTAERDHATGAGTRGHADASTEMSARRTGMSFQRTRLSADRTLMSVIRTSLFLISFGFTVFQFVSKLTGATPDASRAPRTFGSTLVWLGIAMLVMGIVYHVQFMLGLRAIREETWAEQFIHGASRFPVSMTLLTAVILLAIGIFAVVSMTFHIGPFR